MPLQRRLPKRGFTNVFKKEWIEVNLDELDERFSAADEITPELMAERGVIKRSHLRSRAGVVVLGRGDVRDALRVTAHRFTTAARNKIEAKGGKTTVV